MNDIIIEEVKRDELVLFSHVPESKRYWKASLKESGKIIGYVAAEKQDDVLIISAVDYSCSEDKIKYSTIVFEMFLNQAFYRLNVRKVVFDFVKTDIAGMMSDFEFRLESLDEGEMYSLYKEEYIGWLRRQGKTLGFLQTKNLKIVFLMVALVGVVLLACDFLRNTATMQTLFFAYVIGIGTAGAITCIVLDSKNRKRGHHVG